MIGGAHRAIPSSPPWPAELPLYKKLTCTVPSVSQGHREGTARMSTGSAVRPIPRQRPASSRGLSGNRHLVPLVALVMMCTSVAGANIGSDESPRTMMDCTRSLQSLIDAAPRGSVVDVAPCIYRETVTIRRPLTLRGNGAVIDGRDPNGRVARSYWMFVD